MLFKVLSSIVQYSGLYNGYYVHFVFMLLHGKPESIYRSMWSVIDLNVESII